MKRALVTGGHGFVASHLARALLERGDAVRVLDRPTRAPTSAAARSGLDLLGIRAEVELVEADLRDAEAVARGRRRAATPSSTSPRRRSSASPAIAAARPSRSTCAAPGTLLRGLPRARGRAVVFASSDKAYGASPELPYREDFPLRAAYPYDASKAAADIDRPQLRATPTACRSRSPASPTSTAAATSTSRA